MTIQAIELRINNWVLEGDVITKINGVLVDCVDTSISHNQIFENIEPIPLTEEILLKAGFDKQGMAYIISVPKKHNSFHITKWSDGRFMYDGYLNCEIQYLHQLQNLYFTLTGQELEINL